ncbi:MAG: DegT/DnrJ/EryC1/StrS family aminotransferase [Candidatus Rokubacteria bacterium]|nr:DegT/DnrJ/EryC1/StrS family aminotransferase [Candidatus Rokubacteria bacterium]
MIPQIDLTRQHAALKAELLAAVERVLDSSRFVLGAEGEALERELAALCGASYAVGVASGTDALRLALTALGIGPGDEVITPAFSFVASASAILHVGARPVFADIDLDTFALAPAEVERAMTPRSRAIVAVHLYGHPAEMDRLTAIARGRGLALLEDAAQAVGAAYAGRPVGAWGDAACLSFYPTKHLGACGDAGMVVTDRADVAERVRRLRHHGARERYHHAELGWCSRLDELQATLLRVKLRHLPGWIEARRRLASRYAALLGGLPLALPVERPPARHVYQQYTVRFRARDTLARALAELGVETAVHYPLPLPAQPLFREIVSSPEQAFPRACQASREVLSLPCYPELTDAETETVAKAVHQALADRVKCES